MTEEEREKLINDMEIAILKEGVGTILHSSQLSRMALAALVIAEEAISKDYHARIAELEAMRKRDVDCVKRASIRISELERRAALKGEK